MLAFLAWVRVPEREGRQPQLNMNNFKEKANWKCKHFWPPTACSISGVRVVLCRSVSFCVVFCRWPALAWPGLACSRQGLPWPALAWPALASPALAWPALAWPPWPALAWPGPDPGKGGKAAGAENEHV